MDVRWDVGGAEDRILQCKADVSSGRFKEALWESSQEGLNPQVRGKENNFCSLPREEGMSDLISRVPVFVDPGLSS